MLTTDLCLVYNSNKVFDKCFRTYGRKDNYDQFVMRYMECQANVIDSYGDLDPAVQPPCCAWIHPQNSRRDGQYEALSGDFEFCGTTVPEGSRVGAASCCKFAGGACNNCDNAGFPQGIAYTQVTDFANDESLWLKYFLMAWHRATENGFELSYLNQEEGPAREDPEEGEDYDCSPYTRTHHCLEQKDHCRWISMGYFGFFFSGQKSHKCINRFIPQAH